MSSKQTAILVGGLVSGVLSSSYLGLINFACCAGIIIGGIVSVWYVTDTERATIETGDGALLGAGAGIVGLIVSTVLTLAVTGPLGISFEQIVNDFTLSMDLPEATRQQMENQAEDGSTLLQMGIEFILGVVVSSIFGAIGGAMGASIFQKGDADATASPSNDF